MHSTNKPVGDADGLQIQAFAARVAAIKHP
jgi:hypothetical protein